MGSIHWVVFKKKEFDFFFESSSERDSILCVIFKKRFNSLRHIQKKKRFNSLSCIQKKFNSMSHSKSSTLCFFLTFFQKHSLSQIQKKVQFFESYSKKKVQPIESNQKTHTQFFESNWRKKKRFNSLSHIGTQEKLNSWSLTVKRLQLFESYWEEVQKKTQFYESFTKSSILWVIFLRKKISIFESLFLTQGSILWIISVKKEEVQFCKSWKKVQFFEFYLEKRLNSLRQKGKGSTLCVA